MRGWRASTEAIIGVSWYLIIVVLLPAAVLTCGGLIWLWQNEYLLNAVALWFGIAAVAYAIFYGRRRWLRDKTGDATAGENSTDDLPDRLQQRPGWSAVDTECWQRSCEQIDLWVDQGMAWPELQPRGLALVADIASSYHQSSNEAAFRFTLPEGLLILEETSRRYREMIEDQLPYADRLTVATMLSVYRRQEQIKTSINWLNWGRRALRLSNPVGAVFGELRDRVTDRVFDQVGVTVQSSLKRLLLQELAQVCIDLYSGKLSVSEAALANYRSDAASADKEREPVAVEPIRVVLLGQVSAGKSSLVNALSDQLQAESDILPTTSSLVAHELETAEGEALTLIDTPGAGSDNLSGELLSAALEADLIIWVSNASQPARSLLSELIALVRRAYAEDASRKPPPEMLVVTHIDKLAAPNGESNDNHRERILESIGAQLGLHKSCEMVAVSLAPDRDAENLSAVFASLSKLGAEAKHAQLNRRRTELSRRPQGFRKRLKQVKGLGRAVVSVARKLPSTNSASTNSASTPDSKDEQP